MIISASSVASSRTRRRKVRPKSDSYSYLLKLPGSSIMSTKSGSVSRKMFWRRRSVPNLNALHQRRMARPELLPTLEKQNYGSETKKYKVEDKPNPKISLVGPSRFLPLPSLLCRILFKFFKPPRHFIIYQRAT